MPKLKSGRSLLCPSPGPRLAARPLRRHQSKTLRSLSSTWPGCSSTKRSAKSKTPRSGKPTGMTTSSLSSADDCRGLLSWCASATSPNSRQLNGRALSCRPRWPKFTARVRFLKVSVGYSALPLRCAGTGWGLPARSPSRKMDTVMELGLSGSRFRSTPTTFCGVIRSHAPAFSKAFACPGSARKYVPSLLKQTFSGEPSPRKSEDRAVEKPTRSSFSARGSHSRTFTSKR
mmetsp:Transcript_46163/g.133788  ORF Transcript_46163/g.133788 Transcript_46163/m.133788 type:complete len:231 (-) Transcript_46163:393-1085(-)